MACQMEAMRKAYGIHSEFAWMPFASWMEKQMG
jgi:hypothetical protein